MTKKKLEMKNDGEDSERFRAMLKTVVNVPKAAIKKREAEQRKAPKPADKKRRA